LRRVRGMVADAYSIDDAMADRLANDPFRLALANTPDIDAGEALLLSLLAFIDDPSVLVTGDKRCIAAFRNGFPDRFALLKNRILSFEQCLLMVCEARGTDYVIDRVRWASSCDGTLRLALSDTKDFEAALQSSDPLR